MQCGAMSLPWCIAVLFYRDSCGSHETGLSQLSSALQNSFPVLIILYSVAAKASEKIPPPPPPPPTPPPAPASRPSPCHPTHILPLTPSYRLPLRAPASQRSTGPPPGPLLYT